MIALAAALCLLEAAPPLPANFERGMSLGLFSADPEYDYTELVREIRTLGATHISIAWVWWQDDVRAHDIRPVPGWSATNEQILRTMNVARAEGLHVTAFPILRLIHAGPSEWRGKISPNLEYEWWQSYAAFIEHAAQLAEAGGAQRLAIGSELMSREGMRGRWKELVEHVRLTRPNLELLYSANWDHFDKVSFWDLVDVVGVTAYWELSKSFEPTKDELVAAWKPIVGTLSEFSRNLGKPLEITEIGYPSIDGAAAWPWNETRKAPLDLEEQRLAYEAFIEVFSRQTFTRGVYFWNWFGFGGKEDGGYTPRRKPAEALIRAWFKAK